MRIKSIFQDYYDSGLVYGIDKTLTYIRTQTYLKKHYFELNKINDEKELHYISNLNKINKNDYKSFDTIVIRLDEETNYEISSNLLLFCGKNIPFIRIAKMGKKDIYDNILEEHFFYNSEETIEFLNLKKGQVTFKRKNNYFQNFREDSQLIRKIEIHFSKLLNFNGFDFLYKLYETPIVLIRNYSINNEHKYQKSYNSIVEGVIINPILKDIKLKKILSNMECYQEITMYLAFLKNPEQEVETITMDDKTIQQSKGFDCYSFKKVGKKGKKC